MRSNGATLNGQLSRIISETGHTDTIVVSDAGLPVPSEVERVDLALRRGIPKFLDVLDTIVAELVVEGITLSGEIKEASPDMLTQILERFPDLSPNFVPHKRLKELAQDARAVVRSGEFTSYSNVILTAGVAY